MTFFEEELRKIMEKSYYNDKVTFFSTMCYVKAGSYIRMRMEFDGDGQAISSIQLTRKP